MRDIIEHLRRQASQQDPFTCEDMLKAADEIERQRAELAAAAGEATRLLESFVHEHCLPVPDWKPLPDLMGILIQLSNAVTIARDYKVEIKRLRSELVKYDEALLWCSAASDFHPGGYAREGWERICQPLIAAGIRKDTRDIIERLRRQSSRQDIRTIDGEDE